MFNFLSSEPVNSIYWCFRYTQLANRLEEPD